MLLKSRVGFAIAGVVVIGGISAAVAVWPMLPHGFALANPSRPQANVSPSATPTTVPTPTQRPLPTRTPAPTRTPIPSLHGTVLSKNPAANSFVLQLDTGATKTVIVNPSTTIFQGSASSLSTLGTGPTWHVDVRGAYQADGTFLASRVDSCSGTGCDT